MPQDRNPFIRGYRNLRIERTLVLSTEEGSFLTYVRLHESQRDLPDCELWSRHCIFNDDFGLIANDQQIPRQLRTSCKESGYVHNVVHAVVSDEDEIIHHIGDSHARNLADEAVKRLTFETGHYSRAWEVSTAHITDEAASYLAELSDIATPSNFLFVAFRIPYSPAIGLKLIATPWTDENLLHVEGITADDLRRQHLDRGMPASLADTLHLAALADIRFLVFDADAPQLDRLPIFDGENDEIADND